MAEQAHNANDDDDGDDDDDDDDAAEFAGGKEKKRERSGNIYILQRKLSTVAHWVCGPQMLER
ncbi:unnamed protein product [Ceratitis capitata]|uniref:(Mediterranean fruit fly) hypothetical protein n=1 Tax=Ceratitis capitata TaxID=7213 RepID=A0A811V113_CERCA|nr:unnamed protein product [Ceratitis capitata]